MLASYQSTAHFVEIEGAPGVSAQIVLWSSWAYRGRQALEGLSSILLADTALPSTLYPMGLAYLGKPLCDEDLLHIYDGVEHILHLPELPYCEYEDPLVIHLKYRMLEEARVMQQLVDEHISVAYRLTLAEAVELVLCAGILRTLDFAREGRRQNEADERENVRKRSVGVVPHTFGQLIH